MTEQSQLRVRPLMIPQRIVDSLLFAAKSQGLSPHAFILELIKKELLGQLAQIPNSDIEALGPSVKILVRLPEDLDAALQKRGGGSPSYLISQALAREFFKERKTAAV